MVSSPIGGVLEGVVIRVNSSGFMLDGRETWGNISKYADPKPAVPPAGARVRCTLDRSGYVRAVEQVAASRAHSGGYNAVKNAAAPESRPAALPGDRDQPSVRPDRETCITRMAVLNAAIATLARAGQAVEPSAALELAASYEQWVTR
jgi:hypothetical protein